MKMKVTQRAKYIVALPLFIVSALALQLVHTIPTYAATLTWTGDGDGTSFSDGDNWSTDSAPVNNDTLTFSVTGLSGSQTLNNDISGLSVSGISFVGTMTMANVYILSGNALTLTGNVTNTITGGYSDTSVPTIQNSLTLAGNTSVSSVHLGTDGSTVNLQSYNLTYAGTGGCGLNLSGNLQGSGALNISGTGINVRGANSSFTGPINLTGTAAIGATSFGSAAAGTTVSGSGQLILSTVSNVTVNEPFTFGGSGNLNSNSGFWGCAGSDDPAVKVTLNGGVELTSNFAYAGKNNIVINNPYTTNGFTFTVAGGASGTLKTPSGEQQAPKETIQLNGDSTDYVVIGTNQTGVLNGTRDGISVNNGGVLKGTGTATTIYIGQGSTVAPGNSPGTLTVLESFNLSGVYQAELLNKDTYDQLAVGENASSTAVNLMSGSTLSTVLFNGWSVKQGDTFRIIDNLSTFPVSGTFDGLAEGTQFEVDGITFSITYAGGDGNDVVLTALNTGTDPDAPNTGVARFVQANPALVAGLGIVAAGMLIAIAVRRRSTR